MSFRKHRPNFIDLKGKRIGRLQIIGQDGTKDKHNRYLWLVKCDCGVTKYFATQSLERNRETCGYDCSLGHTKEYARKPAIETVINSSYSDYRVSARDRKLTFAITKDEFKNLVLSDCAYCNRPPHRALGDCKNNWGSEENKKRLLAIKLNGIDRIDNDKGYLPDNCAPCCETCNRAKRVLSLEEFYSWIKQLSTFLSQMGAIR